MMMKKFIFFILVVITLLGCEPQIPTSSKVGNVEVPVAPESYKMVLQKKGSIHTPINPPLYISIGDSIVVMTDKVNTINKFYLGRTLFKDFKRIENGVEKRYYVGLYKCKFPEYLGINEDIFAIGRKYSVDSAGNKVLEHISVETRLQTQKVYLYE